MFVGYLNQNQERCENPTLPKVTMMIVWIFKSTVMIQQNFPFVELQVLGNVFLRHMGSKNLHSFKLTHSMPNIHFFHQS
jgi:hypothetical protein